jgi:hypothetical protein
MSPSSPHDPDNLDHSDDLDGLIGDLEAGKHLTSLIARGKKIR